MTVNSRSQKLSVSLWENSAVAAKIVACIWVLIFGVWFHKDFPVWLRPFFSDSVINGLTLIVTTVVITALLSWSWSLFAGIAKAKDLELTSSISALSDHVSGLLTNVSDITLRVKDLSEITGDFQTQMNYRVLTLDRCVVKLTQQIDFMCLSQDDHKKKLAMFDDAWTQVSADFEAMESPSVIWCGRLLRDVLREFYKQSDDLDLTNSDSYPVLVDRLTAALDIFESRASEKCSSSVFLPSFLSRLHSSRTQFERAMQKLVTGKTNGRQDKLWQATRLFLYDAYEILLIVYRESVASDVKNVLHDGGSDA